MIGSVLSGRYTLDKEAESDSVFECFKGSDKNTAREVFVRIVRPDVETDATFGEMLGEIVDVLKGIRHNGSERILTCDRQDGRTYLVSESFEGSSVETRLRKLANFSVPVAVAIAIEVGEALEILHAADVIHGDISPKSVFTTAADSVKLVTPGFWQAYAHSEKAARAKVKDMAPYLAPEVTGGEMPSKSSDIYAVGILLWQMLAGRPPYWGDSPGAIAGKHAGSEYPSVRAVVPAAPSALDKVIEKATSKNPLHRYGSVRMLVEDLKIIQDGLRFGRPLSWPLRQETEVVEEPKVAPRLNAVDAQPEKEEKVAKSKRREADVSDSLPAWLSGLVYVLSAMVLIVVGVWVFFNLQKPKSLTVPDLVGKPVEEARKELAKLDLKLRTLKIESSDEYPKDVIIKLAPAPGEDIKQYAYVDATVSSGSRFIKMPDFRGRTVDEVKQMVAELSLKLEPDAIEMVRDRELEKGLVVSQTPEPRTTVERLTAVKIKVSNGNERVRQTDEDLPQTERDLVFTVPTSVEGTVDVRVEIEDERSRRQVYSGSHGAGDEIVEKFTVYGKSVQILVYFDDKLVSSQNKKVGEE